jgi:predicted phage baseplate assembly protein
MLIYRLDRVTTANVVAFLNLLDGKTRSAADFDGKEQELAAEIRATILHVRALDRAVTCGDFEALALRADAQGRVARARCVPRRNLSRDLTHDKPGHVSVIILPAAGADGALPALQSLVQAYLNPRVLITTRPHVVGPFFVDVTVKATVVPLADRFDTDVKTSVVKAVSDFLDPRIGGDEGTGWPFGRDVFVSELYAVIDRLPAVDFVTALSLGAAPADRVMRRDDGKLIGVSVAPHELVRAHMSASDVTVPDV